MCKMSIYSVNIEPLEPLLFGDSRSARAGQDHIRYDQELSPLTLHGALGTLWESYLKQNFKFVDDIMNRKSSDDADALLGFCFRNTFNQLYFPKPLNFRCQWINERDNLYPSDFLKPQKYNDEEIACSVDCKELIMAPPLDNEYEDTLFVNQDLLSDVLTGSISFTESLTSKVLFPRDIYARELRYGIRMDNELNMTEEGMLFVRPYRRFNPGGESKYETGRTSGIEAWWSIPMENKAMLNHQSRIGYLGGDRLRAKFTFKTITNSVPLQQIQNNVKEASSDSDGFFAYVLTPVIRSRDEVALNGRKPIAAVIGKPQYVSGWKNDKSGGTQTKPSSPRELYNLIPPGSVYFFEWQENDDKNKLIADAWLSSISEKGSHAGFGRILIGIWRRDASKT